MRVVIQRVKRAKVIAEGAVLGSIGEGLLVFVGIAHGDGLPHVMWMCDKVARLRLFEDEAGKMNRSVTDTGGGVLVVPQFTLYADASKGNRPGFSQAAPPAAAEPLYEEFVRRLKDISGLAIETGTFGASMEVELVNDGPVTILVEK